MDRAYAASSRALGAIVALIGLALVIATLARGGGPAALGVVLGVAFIGLGSARLYLARASAVDSRR